MTAQDRRITKTRKAIYQAFLYLLNQKDYEAITVQEIIDLADVGRSTFYSHYESKELLLDELCQKLFHHLFERTQYLSPQDYLAHIFQHFKKNQDHVTSLLLSKNDYFIRQLRKELEHDVYPMVADELIKADLSSLVSEQAMDLMAKIAEYPSLLTLAAKDHAPHMLCYYLKELAAAFHTFYNAERVVIENDVERNARLALLAATRQVLGNGLALLGISAPEYMARREDA
mgnify:CR=1 FL=1